MLRTLLSVFKSFLSSEEAPYVVTLFVAAAAWASIRAADRHSDTPFIEYRIRDTTPQPTRTLGVRLRNLTRGTAFQCFQLTVVSRDSKPLSFGTPETWDQILRGTVLILGTARKSDPSRSRPRDPHLPPGRRLCTAKASEGDGEPRLLARGCPVASGASTAALAEQEKSRIAASSHFPILIAASAKTIFVEWEIAIH